MYAEKYARPIHKWLHPSHPVSNLNGKKILCFAGGILFAVSSHSPIKFLKVLIRIYRQAKTTEYYLVNARYLEHQNHQEIWQIDQLPLYPQDSCEGAIQEVTFSYIFHESYTSYTSEGEYLFADSTDLWKHGLRNSHFFPKIRHSHYQTREISPILVQSALHKIYQAPELPIQPYFTRGGNHAHHPLPVIHQQIDEVIAQKKQNPHTHQSIEIAMYDFDHFDIANHLIYAWEQGVFVECFAEWKFVSPLNDSDNISRMRRAGIPICGVIHSSPQDPNASMLSMHTKMMIFSHGVVHSSSYNLHFHIWGGNWENSLMYHAPEFQILYRSIYHMIRGGAVVPIIVNPEQNYNLYYSFGHYQDSTQQSIRSEDVILREIESAKQSIDICMFDLGSLFGIDSHGRKKDILTAIVEANQRGVNVKIWLNGPIAFDPVLTKEANILESFHYKPPIRFLAEQGLPIHLVFYWEMNLSPIHHKFAIFDKHSVITESYNWYGASTSSDETISVTRNKRIAQEFLAEIDLIVEKFRIIPVVIRSS